MTFGLVAHMVFGGNGLIAGFTSFFTKKGSANHILVGRIYGISMLLMAITGFYYAYIRSVNITMLASCLTIYLVLTSWLTVQKKLTQPWVTRTIPSLIGLPVVFYALFLCWQASNGITDSLGKFVVPASIYFIFTAVVLLAFVFDIRLLLGYKLKPNQRMKRHIWRMCITLYVACSSFFQGQQKIFPESLQGSPILAIPENIVLLLMLFWLFKNPIVKLKNKFLSKRINAST